MMEETGDERCQEPLGESDEMGSYLDVVMYLNPTFQINFTIVNFYTSYSGTH